MTEPDDALPGLEHFALKSMDYGQLTGLALACHAVPDAFLLMHVGVGCKNKATAHLLTHDWAEHGNVREGWTEVGDQDLILGASERAGPYLRSWVKRLEPGVVVVTSVTFIDLAGEDLADKLDVAARDLPCPVLHVKTPGYDPDMYAGYAKLVAAVVDHVDWSAPPTAPRQVTVLGNWFDRYEGDHEGNLQQLGALLKLAGLELGPVLLSGKPWADLLRAPESGLVVELPYTLPVRKRLKRRLKQRQVVQTDLPMGIGGTSRWVREVAAAAGVLDAAVERRIEARERYVRGKLATMVERWRSLRVAVVAEPPLAAGLCALLLEVGLQPVFVGLRGRTLGGAVAFADALDRDGHALPEDCRVVEDPSLHGLREVFADLLAQGHLHGVIGSAPDLNALTTLPAGLLAGVEPPDPQSRGPFLVELGFPCRDHHAMMPLPWLGYGGVLVLAQRIVDARRLWDGGRRATFHL